MINKLYVTYEQRLLDNHESCQLLPHELLHFQGLPFWSFHLWIKQRRLMWMSLLNKEKKEKNVQRENTKTPILKLSHKYIHNYFIRKNTDIYLICG